MPRRSKKDDAPASSPEVSRGRWYAPNDAPWGGFINIRVDEAQKEEFHQWCAEKPDEAWRIVDDLLGEGMKVGLSFDRENECYILTFTGTLVEKSTERYCVTSRAGQLGDVIALAAWKHEVLVAGKYGDLRANGRLNNWG